MTRCLKEKGHLFAQLRFYVVNHINGIVATKDVLSVITHFDKETVGPISIVTQIGSYHNVAEFDVLFHIGIV